MFVPESLLSQPSSTPQIKFQSTVRTVAVCTKNYSVPSSLVEITLLYNPYAFAYICNCVYTYVHTHTHTHTHTSARAHTLYLSSQYGMVGRKKKLGEYCIPRKSRVSLMTCVPQVRQLYARAWHSFIIAASGVTRMRKLSEERKKLMDQILNQ